MELKLASWNVNSLAVRLDQVLAWFLAEKVDVLALQETKLVDDKFPSSVFQEAGLYVVFSGQKTYNGVAIISRYPMDEVVMSVPSFEDPQRRILAVTLLGFRLINLYVPNGAAVGTDKYDYKLQWLEKVTAFIKEQKEAYPLLAVVGDFNIAPEDKDVHSPEEWKDSVLVSPLERSAFSAVVSLGLVDSFRHFHQEEALFSWWDYRAASFRRNRGLRIDHILLSNALMLACMDSGIDVTPRRHERPSDHTPVWVRLRMP